MEEIPDQFRGGKMTLCEDLPTIGDFAILFLSLVIVVVLIAICSD